MTDSKRWMTPLRDSEKRMPRVCSEMYHYCIVKKAQDKMCDLQEVNGALELPEAKVRRTSMLRPKFTSIACTSYQIHLQLRLRLQLRFYVG